MTPFHFHYHIIVAATHARSLIPTSAAPPITTSGSEISRGENNISHVDMYNHATPAVAAALEGPVGG